jgi:hypothetical protein
MSESLLGFTPPFPPMPAQASGRTRRGAMRSAASTVTVPPARSGGAERSALPLEIRCRICGYGAVTRRRRLRCPMCGGNDWVEGVNRPR